MSDAPRQPAPADERAATIDKARRHVIDLAAGRARWTMKIPADRREDSDQILIAALDVATDTVASLATATARVRELEARVARAERQREAINRGLEIIVTVLSNELAANEARAELDHVLAEFLPPAPAAGTGGAGEPRGR